MNTKEQLNDEDLIRQYLNADPNVCFSALYKRYVTKVYNRCLSLTHDSEKAQDFTQDIFMRTFERLDHFEAKSSFSTWLYSISFNYCLDQIKKDKRYSIDSLEEHQVNQLADKVDSEAMEEQDQLLSKTLRQLSPLEADLLQMKYLQGMSVQQIAQNLNLTHSAVKMRLKRARQKARQYYIKLANR